MKITDIFPGLIAKTTKLLNKNPSWRKKGPGRRHNPLTKDQQSKKASLMAHAGMNASEALKVLRGH